MSEPPQQPPPPPPYPYGGYPPQQYQGYGGYPPQHYWPPPPPPIDPGRLKPRRLWYWLSAVPAVVGTALAIVFLVVFIGQLDPDLDNFQSNRSATVDVQAGDRAIYVQTHDEFAQLPTPPGNLRCNVAFVGSDPQPVPLESTSGATLDANSDTYRSRFKFDAPHDGPYRVSCEGPEGVRLAIGPHLSFGLFVPLFIAIGAFLVGGLLTTIGLVVTAVRRSNHKQRLQREWREQQARG